MKNQVRHNEEEKRFELTENGKTAYVKYECLPGAMNFIVTFVPEEWQGQGVGSRLAEYALRYAKEQGLKIVATCPFIQEYMDKHQEFSDE